ncbi:MAG: tripartite tricarboxylate transporter substrate binding protein, partial [Candidatus Puniceispirillaceae bacterium]
MAGVMAMSTATVAVADSAIEVITHAGAGGGTDVNARMMMIRTRRAL